ncbi:reverse transcriptase domain-containing protein [Tanacetum coccineum]
MRTRSQSREQRPPPPEGPPVVIEPLRIEYPFQEETNRRPMATSNYAQLLQAPTEGSYPLLSTNHLTMRVPNVPIATIKLCFCHYTIEGAARIWLEKEPPRSIQTWDDLVSKFINQFFPPSKTTNLRNEITRFQQRFSTRSELSSYIANNFIGNNFNKTGRAISTKTEVENFNQSNFTESLHRPQVINLPHISPDLSDTQCLQERFDNYVKANDAIDEKHANNLQNQASTSGSGNNPCSESQYPSDKDQVHPSCSQISLPYPSRRDNEKSRNQANEQIDKFYEIFKEMSFEISFTDALVLMPKFASTLRTLLGNKEKLTEVARTSNEPCLARTSMNEHCSAVILNKLPRKLGDPGKFLIPCEFPGMDECLALADLGASINLMPFSVWEKLSLPDLTPTCMTLELADRSISKPMGIAKDISVKVGVFHFPADFVVVDFEPDPRVPLILGRCFLKTGRALIDVHKGELTLRIGSEAITYNLDQTSRYSANYTHMTANKIDVIDMACEEYSQEVLGFTDIIASGNSTPYYDPIVATSSPTLTPFGDSDFLLLEEADSFLGLADDPDCPAYNPFYYDPEGDILILEAILNSEPPLPPPSQGTNPTYLPEVRTELKVCETNTANSSVDEPTEVELKELPPHLEYAFLEGDNKLPVIIAKELDVEEKSALVKVLKSHKRALAWKLSDIQGINPEFCTHKILMEEDYAPAVQHQRRVNPKIHDVIKKEVEKLLEAGLIYPISDSPWVSPIHCVPKKGGMTVVVNEENELIPTRLVTGWRDSQPSSPTEPMADETENVESTFQRCMLAIFHDMVEKTMEVFMDDFSVFGNSFQNCLSRLDHMLQRCEDTNLSLNWEKSHFMVKEGIVLGHKISKKGIEVDKAKIDVIAKLPHPTTVKGIRSWRGRDFSKISRPMTHLLEKNTPFIFSDDCIRAFQTLKDRLTEAPILIAPNWDLPFELMCDASDFDRTSQTEKELLAIVYAARNSGEIAPMGSTPPELTSKVIDSKEEPRTSQRSLSRLEKPASVCNGNELLVSLRLAHGPTGDIMVQNLTAKKIFDSGFFWPPSIKMPSSLSRTVTRAQRQWKITSQRDEMPKKLHPSL